MGKAIGLEIRKVYGVKVDKSKENVKAESQMSSTIKDEPTSSRCDEEIEAVPSASSSRLEIVA
jgi:hypothetical protein